jgi:Predicted UDP-glucose 6-dehydrogenase
LCQGKGKAADLKYVELAARDIVETVESGFKIVVEKSTVPVKAAESISTILHSKQKAGVEFQVSLSFIYETQIRQCYILLMLPGIIQSGISGPKVAPSPICCMPNEY